MEPVCPEQVYTKNCLHYSMARTSVHKTYVEYTEVCPEQVYSKHCVQCSKAEQVYTNIE